MDRRPWPELPRSYGRKASKGEVSWSEVAMYRFTNLDFCYTWRALMICPKREATDLEAQALQDSEVYSQTHFWWPLSPDKGTSFCSRSERSLSLSNPAPRYPLSTISGDVVSLRCFFSYIERSDAWFQSQSVRVALCVVGAIAEEAQKGTHSTGGWILLIDWLKKDNLLMLTIWRLEPFSTSGYSWFDLKDRWTINLRRRKVYNTCASRVSTTRQQSKVHTASTVTIR